MKLRRVALLGSAKLSAVLSLPEQKIFVGGPIGGPKPLQEGGRAPSGLGSPGMIPEFPPRNTALAELHHYLNLPNI